MEESISILNNILKKYIFILKVLWNIMEIEIEKYINTYANLMHQHFMMLPFSSMTLKCFITWLSIYVIYQTSIENPVFTTPWSKLTGQAYFHVPIQSFFRNFMVIYIHIDADYPCLLMLLFIHKDARSVQAKTGMCETS